MTSNAFLHPNFAILLVSAVLLPSTICAYLLLTRSVSRWVVLLLALVLLVLSGIDLVLLQSLARLAKVSASTLDDKVFAAGISVALYLFPAVFASIGANLLSHALLSHLVSAEKRFEREHVPRGSAQLPIGDVAQSSAEQPLARPGKIDAREPQATRRNESQRWTTRTLRRLACAVPLSRSEN
jgi:hypothetical protein